MELCFPSLWRTEVIVWSWMYTFYNFQFAIIWSCITLWTVLYVTIDFVKSVISIKRSKALHSVSKLSREVSTLKWSESIILTLPSFVERWCAVHGFLFMFYSMSTDKPLHHVALGWRPYWFWPSFRYLLDLHGFLRLQTALINVMSWEVKRTRYPGKLKYVFKI